MPIEFREVRREEIDDALAFAVDQGADISKPAVRHQLSLVAVNTQKTILGSALHEVADDARRHIHIHLKPDTHPGLGQLLVDRALRKAEAGSVATTHVTIHHDEADQNTWDAADWLSRLRPAKPQTTASVTPNPTATPVIAAAESANAETPTLPAETSDDSAQAQDAPPADPLPEADAA